MGTWAGPDSFTSVLPVRNPGTMTKRVTVISPSPNGLGKGHYCGLIIQSKEMSA